MKEVLAEIFRGKGGLEGVEEHIGNLRQKKRRKEVVLELKAAGKNLDLEVLRRILRKQSSYSDSGSEEEQIWKFWRISERKNYFRPP